MTEVKRSVSTELAIRDDQVAFTPKQQAALAQIGVDGASNADVALLFHFAKRTGLDPFAKQLYMLERKTWNPERNSYDKKWTLQTGIDGFRLAARRAADRAGETLEYEDTLWCGPDGAWTDVWLSDEVPPTAAKVTVLRNGKRFPAVAKFSEYAAYKDEWAPDIKGPNGEKIKGKKTGNKVLSGQWPKMPAVMIAKCAEALALRKAFPQDLSGLYTEEEMAQVDNPGTVAAGDVVDGVVEPDTSGVDWKAKIACASTLDDCRRLYAEAREANAPLWVPTAITQRSQEIKAHDANIVDAEVVAEKVPAA